MRQTHVSPLWPAICAAAALLMAAPAVADVGPALYVANDGADRGDCVDAVAPCKTLGYALGVAGKNAEIRVAPGTYEITDPSDVIHMLSGAVSVKGGYRAGAAPAAGERSMISGVPLEYRELLRERGFHVIVDKKGLDIERAAEARRLLRQYEQAQISTAAAPCQNGSAGGFACANVDLLAHVARSDISAQPASLADIWGFVDLNTNREYAIVGVSVGTAVFDVTDPQAPREIGFIDGQSATWRDIKVYQYFDAAAARWHAYAYVTTDGANDGLFVIDLGGLPHSIRRVSYVSDIPNAHNVYITSTDYGSGLRVGPAEPQIIVAGSGIGRGQFRSYSLANPAFPAFEQSVSSAGYMHDATSLTISDQRTAQCASPGSPCEVLLDFNENNVELWDVTDAANPTRLVQVSAYQDTGYVHSGWWSEDRQYFFVHDELDETNPNSVLFTTLRIFSIPNLTNPILEGIWTGPTPAIDHNGFVRGNRYYMSTYTRGLTILDLSDPVAPVESGFFDTYAASDDPIFAGAWGAYPFFPSGTVALSDINSGMYLLADRSLDVPQGRLSLTSASFAASEGQQASLTVARQGGSSGTVSVDYEVLAGTADDADYQPVSGTLSWGAGDSADRSIAIDVATDGAAEPLERLLVRLVNPTGGATLGPTHTASLYLSDPAATSEVRLFADAFTVPERGFGRAVIVLQRAGTALGAISVDYSITSGDAVLNTDFQGPASGTLSWADGDGDPKTIEYTIVDDGAGEPDEFFELSFSNGLTARVTIADGLGSNTAPNAIAGLSQSIAAGSIVTLDGTQSNDPDGDALAYAWSQTAGPAVTLNNPDAAIATFTAPTVSSDTLLTFQLEVTDPQGLSDVTITNVTVTNGSAPAPSSGSGAAGPMALLLLALFYARYGSRRSPSRRATRLGFSR